jgi:hypothetical protein
VSAISRSPSSGSGWSMQNPCDESFMRGDAAGAAAALALVVAADAALLVRSGTVVMSLFPRAHGLFARGSATPEAKLRRGEPVHFNCELGMSACDRAEQPVPGSGMASDNCATVE